MESRIFFFVAHIAVLRGHGAVFLMAENTWVAGVIAPLIPSTWRIIPVSK